MNLWARTDERIRQMVIMTALFVVLGIAAAVMLWTADRRPAQPGDANFRRLCIDQSQASPGDCAATDIAFTQAFATFQATMNATQAAGE